MTSARREPATDQPVARFDRQSAMVNLRLAVVFFVAAGIAAFRAIPDDQSDSAGALFRLGVIAGFGVVALSIATLLVWSSVTVLRHTGAAPEYWRDLEYRYRPRFALGAKLTGVALGAGFVILILARSYYGAGMCAAGTLAICLLWVAVATGTIRPSRFS